MREAFEANDWAQLDGSGLSDFGDFEDADDKPDDDKEIDPESLDFGFDKADFEGLKAAIWSSGQADTTAEDAKMAATGSNDLVTAEAANKAPGEKPDAETDPDDEEVAKMERMMKKLQAVRDAGEGMAPEQRRRMAARAVGEVMKEL